MLVFVSSCGTWLLNELRIKFHLHIPACSSILQKVTMSGRYCAKCHAEPPSYYLSGACVLVNCRSPDGSMTLVDMVHAILAHFSLSIWTIIHYIAQNISYSSFRAKVTSTTRPLSFWTLVVGAGSFTMQLFGSCQFIGWSFISSHLPSHHLIPTWYSSK